MFRLSHYMRALIAPAAVTADTTGLAPALQRRAAQGGRAGPVVIWNLSRRCNLACRHCYNFSADARFKGELSTDAIWRVLDDLHHFRVPVLILSGGEPLLHPDIDAIGQRAKQLGFYVALSTNGTLIDDANIGRIAAVGYDYVGISIDGLEPTHDHFRGRVGAFQDSLRGVRLCREAGLRVGLRFTLTQDNAGELPGLFELMDREGVEKFYLSHLNYAGRGFSHRGHDAVHAMTRATMEYLFTTAEQDAHQGRNREIVTGNNDADGVFLLHWAAARFPSAPVTALRQALERWGGNASGVGIGNIDARGEVHLDSMWGHYSLGNVTQRAFGAIWTDTSAAPLLAGLKQRPRPVTGRCASCTFLSICNGNTRVRAEQTSGDPWTEDPGCYLTDGEIAVPPDEIL